VGLYLERSIEMVLAIYATIKAGGAYVPIDPGYPFDRTAFMVQDADAPVILIQQRLRDRLPETTAQVVAVDAECWISPRLKEPGNDPFASATLAATATRFGAREGCP
jgi:non-ribosomal peptide synthetase component F